MSSESSRSGSPLESDAEAQAPTRSPDLERPAVEPGNFEVFNVGWTKAVGLRAVRVTAEEVVLELTVSDQHKQPFGLVHGAVYCGLVETGGSVGAQLAAKPGMQVVGVENQTSFLRPIKDGTLRSRSVPLHVGRRSQLWETRITDADGRLAATGRLRIMCVPTG